MLKQRPFLIETLTAIGLIAAPFVLPYLGFAPNTVNRILVWGLFGLGFDILFGFTGLLSKPRPNRPQTRIRFTVLGANPR